MPTEPFRTVVLAINPELLLDFDLFMRRYGHLLPGREVSRSVPADFGVAIGQFPRPEPGLAPRAFITMHMPHAPEGAVSMGLTFSSKGSDTPLSAVTIDYYDGRHAHLGSEGPINLPAPATTT
ncbi:hypothetical protein ACFRFJ_15985 [Streptomyces hydrogenans]|uniref:hypothetical protein n=1 Tax=Streptomyces hydrogenans TaxID=1873719 RepID=UPI0036BD6C01